MKRLNYYISLTKAYLHRSFYELAQHPATTLLWCVSTIGREITGFVGILLIARTLGGLGGWNLYELCILFGMAMIPEALGQLFFDSVWNIGSRIRGGQMDMFMVRPIPILYQLLLSWCFFPGILNFLSGLAIVLYGAVQIGVPFTVGKLLFLIEFSVCGTILNSSIYLCFNSLNFWLVQGEEISDLIQTFRQFAKYPLTAFPTVVKFCMTCIIPFGFTAYYPTLYLIGKGGRMIPLILPLVTAIVATVGLRIWSAGIRGYNSTGT